MKYKVIQFKLNDNYPIKVVVLKGEEVIYVNGYHETWEGHINETLISKFKRNSFKKDKGLLKSVKWHDELKRIQNELKRRGIKFKEFI